MSFFAELNRRNVVRVGIAYVVIGWVLAQVAEFALENFGAPDWALKSFVTLLLLGLPLALFLAWAYELTPGGIKREQEVDRSESITRVTGRKLDRFIIVVLVVAVGYFLWERQAGDEPARAAATEIEAQPVADVSPSVEEDAKRRSIAVLPFVNMSSDQDQEWFSDGLTEEILNALARTPDLLVAARTSSFKYKGSNEDITSIANALGVAHVLEGSVRSGGDRLRVTAQLIRASDGFHLWSQTYDRDPEDVIAIQEEIAIEIATALETAMDPEALAQMVSSGTSSVPAFNAYLEGQAIDSGTLSTGDTYSFLAARDAYKLATEIDPEFAYAYWELAQFWEVQLRSSNIVAGIVELPREEMKKEFKDAIDKAIRFERDPINQIRVRVLQAIENLQVAQALRLNTAYLRKRPNDQTAQNYQLELLADVGDIEKLRATIEEFEQRDGYDLVVNNNSITFTMLTGDKEFARRFARDALRRMPDRPFLQYQAHRTLLYAGDIDGAVTLIPAIEASDMPEDTRLIIHLRQACAEGKIDEARRVFDRFNTKFGDELSMAWISHKIMGLDEEAHEILAPLDQSGDLEALMGFVAYHYFDASLYPNLAALLRAQGIEPRKPLEMPYRCRT
jgi:TolB-like protein/tetratricopeptide (TPR) repeat protein